MEKKTLAASLYLTHLAVKQVNEEQFFVENSDIGRIRYYGKVR